MLIKLKILQNPQGGSLMIELENTDIVEIKVVDISGKVIFQQPTINMKTIIIDNLPTGIYFLD